MDVKKGLLIGCAGCLTMVVVAGIAFVVWVGYIAQDPQGVAVEINAPMDVTLGEIFALDIMVTNERSDEEVGLTDIDVAEEYLEAFTVVSTTPGHRSSEHIPIDNTRSFTFDHPVAPGETAIFTFELRAERTGIFRGDVDVCEGQRFLSQMVQTVVNEPTGAEAEASS